MGEAKRKQQTICPALGRQLSRVECASGRNSTTACPATCPLNPFAPANYVGLFMPLEHRVLDALQLAVVPELTRDERIQIRRAVEDRDTYVANAMLIPKIHAPGVIDRWEEAGIFEDFNNDERTLLRCLKSLRPALFEIQQRVDEVSVMACDLLRPEAGVRLLIDRSTAGRASRFRTYLTWGFDVPAGWRALGTGVEAPAMLPRGPREVVECLMEHFEAPAEGREAWLFEHMPVILRALGTTTEARKRGVTEPSELVPAELLVDLDRSEHARYRVVTAEPTAAGRAAAFRECYEGFADRPLRIFAGISPRAAAADPVLRPLLVRLMKVHAVHCDDERLRGVDVDINQVFAPLGLTEWLLPPGPLGKYEEETPPQPEPSWREVDEAAGWEGEDDVTVFHEPRIQPMLTKAEIERRWLALMADPGSLRRGADQWVDLRLIAEHLSRGTVGQDGFELLMTGVVIATSLLHPQRPPGLAPHPRRAERKLRETMELISKRLGRGESGADLMMELIGLSPQPEVAHTTVEVIAEAVENGEHRLAPEMVMIISLVLLAIIWELCHWPPSPGR